MLGGTFCVAYGRRSYSPELGRWINRDPIGEGNSFNVSSFCNNNGGNGIDILGLSVLNPLIDSGEILVDPIDENLLTKAKNNTDRYLRVSLVDSTNGAFGMFYTELKSFTTTTSEMSVSFSGSELQRDDHVLVNAYVKPKNSDIVNDVRPYVYSKKLPNGQTGNHDAYNHVSWENGNGINVSELWREGPPGSGYSAADMWTVDSMLRGGTPDIYGISYVVTVYSVDLPACDVRSGKITGVEVFVHDYSNADAELFRSKVIFSVQP